MQMLVVIKAEVPESLVAFYGAFGLVFTKERHGKGPEHFACEIGGSVLEIYPRPSGAEATTATRLGFGVRDVSLACDIAVSRQGRLVKPVRDTAWGRRAVLADPEGHFVEVVENSRQAA